MADYEVSAVARVPQSAGPPDLVELERVAAGGLSWERELNRPGSIDLGVPVDSLAEPVKLRLRELSERPLEVWVRRDGQIVAAGPVLGWQIQGPTLTLTVHGLLAYTRYMAVDADTTFALIDQHLIAKALIDQWQALGYGHFGLDTSGITASGMTRDRIYNRADLVIVYRALELLTGVDDGFDISVDPATRDVVLSSPQQGTDLSNSVHLDRRNITSARVQASVAPGDVASRLRAVATGTDLTTTVIASNSLLQVSFGNAFHGESFDGVSRSSTLLAHARMMRDARSRMLLVPGPELIPVAGADVGDFDVGDVVEYSFDAGLGEMIGTYRVAKLRVSVDETGSETMAVEFV